MEQTNKIAVSVREAAAMLSVSTRTIRSYLRQKALPYRKIGKRTVIPVRALEAFLRTHQCVTDLVPKDHHERRMQHALRQIWQPNYRVGMIRWLRKGEPALYDDLTCRLPDLIQRLWSEHAPIEEFQAVLDLWLAAHRRADALFRSREV